MKKLKNNWYAWTLRSFTIACVALFFSFFIAKTAFGAPAMVSDDATFGGWENDNPVGFVLTASSTIDDYYSIVVQKLETSTTTATDIIIYMCEGSPDTDPTDYGNTYACGASGNNVDYVYNCYDCFDDNDLSGEYEIIFPTTFDIDPTKAHYVSIKEINGDNVQFSWGSNTGYIGHDPDWSAIRSMGNFQLWTDTDTYTEENMIDIPNWSGHIEVGSEFPLDVQYDKVCFLNSPCLYWFGYNWDYIGADVYLTPDLPGQRVPGASEYSGRELLADDILKDYFTIDDPGVPARQNYCLYLDKEEDGEEDLVYCGIEIRWIDDTFIAEWFEEECLDDPCGDLATSTDWYSFDFLYGIQCGMRRVTDWLTCPSTSTVASIVDANYRLDNTFPFTIVNQVRRELEKVNFRNATATSITLEPLIPGYTTELSFATSSMGIAGDFIDDLRVWFRFLIYGFFFFYLIMRVMYVTRSPREA